MLILSNIPKLNTFGTIVGFADVVSVVTVGVCCLAMSRSVEESFNMSDESGGPNLGVTRKKKIAIGVIFLLSPNEEENSRFQDFFFSHFPLFESHMNKLKSAIEQVRHQQSRNKILASNFFMRWTMEVVESSPHD